MVSFLVYIAFISICVAYCVVRSELGGGLKMLAILILLHGYLTCFSTFRDVSGYPTTQPLPEEFEILWGRVIEKQDGEASSIEIWITHDFSIIDSWISKFSLANPGAELSRVYYLPYSKENHKFILEMQQKIQMGKKVGVSFADISMDDRIDLREAASNYSMNWESRMLRKQPR